MSNPWAAMAEKLKQQRGDAEKNEKEKESTGSVKSVKVEKQQRSEKDKSSIATNSKKNETESITTQKSTKKDNTKAPGKKSLWDDFGDLNNDKKSMVSVKSQKSIKKDIEQIPDNKSLRSNVGSVKSSSKKSSHWNDFSEADLIKLRQLKKSSFWDDLDLEDIRKLGALKGGKSENEHVFQKTQECPYYTSLLIIPNAMTNFEPPMLNHLHLQTPNVHAITTFELNEFRRKHPGINTVVFSTPPFFKY